MKVAYNINRVYFADADILKIFSIPLLFGDQASALQQTRAIVISETEARRFFVF